MLIVARMDPTDAEAVKDIFAESDATELPRMMGARARSVFRFHDLYLHLVEAEQDVVRSLDEVNDHPLFRDVNAKLAPYVRPYTSNWSGPKDSLATRFYHWAA
ncbi:TcmI family type II polyketide cyclase [Wenjunlia tyrosinilytica]|jgi:cyclase|uniref:Polyketide synthase n=1 Tax=Wenjunlia tyrosinilytica TaxID=1544741 RepID=A0A917ZWD7_9ACTN|nr:TcmI family type II polyketide cyclase [Wenjunlia tyrosinilytica]GGO97286.1 polyketide synthase [Wenjunlia tyrosinilytica]